MPRGINDFDTGRIQGRNVGNANSSNIVAPGIVTDGLYLHLDAGNYNSYPIANTTWYDLSDRRNNANLVNGPTYSRDGGGAIVFDGSNDYATVPSSARTFSQVTFMAWIKRNGASPQWAGIILNRDTGIPGSACGIVFRNLTNQLGYLWAGDGFGFVSNLTPPDGAWCLVGASMVGNISTLFLAQASGTSTAVDTARLTTSVTWAANNLYVGYDPSWNVYKGSMAQALIYTRALSVQEMQQNFNATRARFNI
jgi:hypothetical protein